MMNKRRTLNLIVLMTVFFVGLSGCSKSDGSIVFIGDSIADYWNVKKSFPSFACDNRGIAGSVLDDLKKRDKRCGGAILVVCIGANDMGHPIEEDVYVSDLLETVGSYDGHKILLLSILPNSFENVESTRNEKIRKVNDLIKSKISDSRITFVDLFDSFLLDGEMNPQYSFDGLHPNAYGYELMTKAVLKYL